MISRQQIDQFHKDGFLIINLEIGDKLIDRIIADTVNAYPRNGNNRYRHGTRLENFWLKSRNVKRLALLPEILLTLEKLYLRLPRPFQTLNFPTGTEQAMHADTIHFNSFPNNFMCGVWVALEDVNADNGPVTYCPGSHRLPEYNMQDVGTGINHDNYGSYEAFIQRLLTDRKLEPGEILLQKGQALIWHGNLLHGGSPHRDKDRSRHSQLTHYFFSGCRYYAPIYSTADEIYMEEPQWITYRGLDAARFAIEMYLKRNFGT